LVGTSITSSSKEMVLSFSLASTGVGILLQWKPNVNHSDIKMMRISSLCTAALYPAYISVHWYTTWGEVGRGSCQLLLISASSHLICLLH